MNRESISEIRISPDNMLTKFLSILVQNRMETEKANSCANIFMKNSLDGIYSHGVNRFAGFIDFIKRGVIDVGAEPTFKSGFGVVEQWDGNSGPGPINATKCCNRVMQIADKSGMGCVALSDTNHWMRGGTYGWQAAKAGYIFIGWTNTTGLMPSWGATDCKIGNNPIVFALPYQSEAIVLDMAISQFSYGAMENYKRNKTLLPYNGGYDIAGNLSKIPADILESKRPLPIGYWKGAGLALLLDLLATILSDGHSTAEISREKDEKNLSQVYIAISLDKLPNKSSVSEIVNNIIADYHNSVPENEKTKILYPGERVLNTRANNLKNGIPVDTNVWNKILELDVM